MMALFGAAMFPNLLYSMPNPENSLTLVNGSSTRESLVVMTYIAILGVPARPGLLRRHLLGLPREGPAQRTQLLTPCGQRIAISEHGIAPYQPIFRHERLHLLQTPA